MSQSVLPFDFLPSYRREDFIVSPANAEAHTWITRWPEWPSPALNLYGAAGSGKTHLARIWQDISEAGEIAAAQVGVIPSAPLLAGKTGCVIDAIRTPLASPEAWFHLLNSAREEGISLLLVSETPLARIRSGLADLDSRLAALPAVTLRNPDDVLLEALLAKRFADMQLRVPPEVLRYLLNRMERTFTSVEGIVNKIDRLSLVEKRNISLPLARKIMETQ